MERTKLDKLVEARLALRARFEQKMRETPSQSDPSPQGTGPANRHGMPEIPVGQVQTKKWPVLDLGVVVGTGEGQADRGLEGFPACRVEAADKRLQVD